MQRCQNSVLAFLIVCASIFLLLNSLSVNAEERGVFESNKNNQLLLEIDRELAQLDSAYEVYYDQNLTARKLKATYHHALLAQDEAKEMLVLQLSDQMQAVFARAELTVLPAIEYRLSRREQLLRIKQQMIEVESASIVASSLSASSGTEFSSESQANVEPGIPGFPCYATVEETFSQLDQLENGYPQLAEVIDIGDSWEKTQDPSTGYDILVLKITNKAILGDKPILFVQSAMHAREYATAALTLDFAHYLLQGYGSDADVEWIVDFHEIHLLVHMNPDGRKIAESGLRKRKNTNNAFCPEEIEARGVDLNRNFSFFWGAGEETNASDFVVSDEPCSDVYRGPYAASEPETQAVENYARTIFPDLRGINKNDPADEARSGLYLDIHSFGNLILYPYSHTIDASPNNAALRRLARRLAYFNNYIPAQGPELYLVSGSSESIAYGELGVAHLTFELGNTFFESCDQYEQVLRPHNLDALLHAAKISKRPYELSAGPYFTDAKIKTGDNPEITRGSSFLVQAVVDDNVYGLLNGDEEVGVISAVDISLDRHFYESEATIVSLDAENAIEDGVLDEVKEQLRYEVAGETTAGLSLGEHTFYLRGRDNSGNYGPAIARAFTLIDQAYLRTEIDFVCRDSNFCRFEAKKSIDTDGEIQAHRWRFNDGRLEAGTDVTHFFKSNGLYEVVLEVVGEDGEVASTSTMIEIALQGTPPEIDYSVRCDGLSCQLDASASFDAENDVGLYRWRFDDGTEYRGALVDKVFPSGGVYQVSLFLRDRSRWQVEEEFELAISAATSFSIGRPASSLRSPSGENGQGGGGAVNLLSLFSLLLLLWWNECWAWRARLLDNWKA